MGELSLLNKEVGKGDFISTEGGVMKVDDAEIKSVTDATNYNTGVRFKPQSVRFFSNVAGLNEIGLDLSPNGIVQTMKIHGIEGEERIKVLLQTNLSNSLVETREGYALDARQGKVLNDTKTALTLNGTATKEASIYAPTTAGDSAEVLTGGTSPTWEDKKIFVAVNHATGNLTLAGGANGQWVGAVPSIDGYKFIGTIGVWTSAWGIGAKVVKEGGGSQNVVVQAYNPTSSMATFRVEMGLLYCKTAWVDLRY